MAISNYETDNVAVIVLSGKFLDDDKVDGLRDCVQKLIDQDQTRIVCDLAEVEMMSSSCIGALVAGLKALREVDGDLKLARMPEKYAYPFYPYPPMKPIFHLYEDLDEAVSSFEQE